MGLLSKRGSGRRAESGLGEKDTLTQLDIVLSDGDVFKASAQEPRGYKRTLTFTGLFLKKKKKSFSLCGWGVKLKTMTQRAEGK